MVGDLQTDIEKVTGVQPDVVVDEIPPRREVVIVGTIGHSPLIDPTVIVQNIVVDTGGLEPSYLGPPESLRAKGGRR